jgi:hypothetical protein
LFGYERFRESLDAAAGEREKLHGPRFAAVETATHDRLTVTLTRGGASK